MFDFVNVKLDTPDVEPVNKNGVRFYKVPDTDKYFPSVTSSHRLRTHSSSKNGEPKLVNKRQIVSLLELLSEELHFIVSQKIISEETWTSIST